MPDFSKSWAEQIETEHEPWRKRRPEPPKEPQLRHFRVFAACLPNGSQDFSAMQIVASRAGALSLIGKDNVIGAAFAPGEWRGYLVLDDHAKPVLHPDLVSAARTAGT